ncbi:MAG: branched-chain amino acid ABC transporter permease [Burkholderiales bacterium]
MSAAYWRRAMNGGASSAGAGGALPETPSAVPATHLRATAWWRAIRLRHVLVMLALLVYPWVASPFFTFQIAGQALVLGLIALSLTLLAGYGGMVSLAQMTVAGIAGYVVAIFGTSAADHISLGWPWWAGVILALGFAVAAGAFTGWLSVRTEGIYTIMITLSIGVAFYYFCLQNVDLFNGFQGFQKVLPPNLFGLDWREPVPFYHLALFWALAGYFLVKHVLRAPFGLALQGVRDNARRMNALGFDVNAHRIAAYALAGLIAGVGGILLTWYNTLTTPTSINVGKMIVILVVAILGGIRHPIGPFIGAVVFVLMQTFGMDVASQVLGDWARDRFNSVIGVVFLLIVLFSPDGLLGWWAAFRARWLSGRRTEWSTPRHSPQQQGR